MADGRMLKKTISTSQKLSSLKSDSARLLYTWLLAHLDIEGRFSADPDVVKGLVVPRLSSMTPHKVKKHLEEMASVGLIILYDANGDKFLELAKFKDFQRLRTDREAASIIPPIDPHSNITPGVVPEDSRTSKVKESKVKESKKTFREFVKLTEKEYQKLIEKNGKPFTDCMIEILNNGIGSKGYKYKSHYYVMKQGEWVYEKAKERMASKPKAGRSKPVCEKCKRFPSMGQFDDGFEYCERCWPNKDKALVAVGKAQDGILKDMPK